MESVGFNVQTHLYIYFSIYSQEIHDPKMLPHIVRISLLVSDIFRLSSKWQYTILSTKILICHPPKICFCQSSQITHDTYTEQLYKIELILVNYSKLSKL